MGQLRRQLGVLDIFAVASGAMISSGLFILPALAYAKAGPAVIVSYLLASLLIVPSVLSKAELATAMPRAGGTYFYVERSLGPILGLFSGLANWFSLALKSAFAVVGMAILIELAVQEAFRVRLDPYHLKIIGVACCTVFTVLNIVSVKHASRLQILLVAALLAILLLFIVTGAETIRVSRYEDFLRKGWLAVFATAGLVFVSFGGLTKVASIAEEVRHPGRNLPLGMTMAWFVVSLLYLTVVAITVGAVDGPELAGSLMPISLAAGKATGAFGYALLSLAAVAAFVTTANGGILAASRSPMAMSRDQLVPGFLARVNKRFGTPHSGVLLTGAFMIAAIVFLDIEALVKTASTLMIILFILDNASVIAMRESKIQSYRPLFRSPMYPYFHIFAIVAYAMLIVDMGRVPLSISGGFVILSAAWYWLYVSKRVKRASAVMHIVERVTDKAIKTVTLENELRDILIERDNIIEDRFDQLIKDCEILDIDGARSSEQVLRQAADVLAQRLGFDELVLFEKFLHRETEGGTVVQPGLAIPHIIVEGENKFDVLLVRARDGIKFPYAQEPVRVMFILAGSKDQRNYHLRALMAIAQIVQEKQFEEKWLHARDVEGIRNLILLSARQRDQSPAARS
ncbi:MAG: amino acid permease [Sedimentisphaerales bacterium]|nr:amino acid permease [Sedimentisphaerales bacterium]